MAKEQELEFGAIAEQVLAEAKSKKGPDLGTVAKALLCCGLSLNRAADELRTIGTQLKYLGNGNALTEMGAIEGLGVAIKESVDGLSHAILEAGNAISDKE